MVGETSIRPATVELLAEIRALLSKAGLSDTAVEANLATYFVALDSGNSEGAEGHVVGTIGLEVHGGDGLLKSLAVDPSVRGAGLGSRLVRAVVDEADSRKLRRIVLLTTDADGYFGRLGFSAVPRDSIQGPVRDAGQFRDECPETAIVMIRSLTN